MTNELLNSLRGIVGATHVIPADEVRDSAWQTHQPFRGLALVCPSTTAQVAAVLAACNEACQTVVPLGGLTGLVQGCATEKGDIGLSLEKMQLIEGIDAVAQTMTVQAGVTLGEAQAAVDEAGLYFPLDIGARDNCMLGGNVATNAGGTKVIRYGMTRDSVLGLEVVLANGTVISSMNRFIKNNSGFDLKQLFIGTEGTLGVITRIVFRLAVKARSHNVAFLACNTYEDVVQVLSESRELLGSSLSGFEVMWHSFYRQVTQPLGPQPALLPADLPYYVIVEAMGAHPQYDDEIFTGALESLMANGRVVDGILAKSDKERKAIWAIREEVEWLISGCFNFDVSLPVVDVADYVETVSAGIVADVPGAIVAAFGHLGDNNIHLSVLLEENQDAFADVIQEHVYQALIPYAGAISAEHGIGLEKRAYLGISRTVEEIELMRSLKTLLDPNNILNPGKVIDCADS